MLNYKKKSADFRQRLQGSPQTTTQLVRACTYVHTLNMCCSALNFRVVILKAIEQNFSLKSCIRLPEHFAKIRIYLIWRSISATFFDVLRAVLTAYISDMLR